MQIPKYQSPPKAIDREPDALVVASASLSGLVLTPVAVLAGALGVWRFGADAGWTGSFFITGGLLSRYQLWFAVAIAAQTSALILKRWVRNESI